MRQRLKRRSQDGRKLAYSMNHNMSTKNLIHLQAGGRTGPLFATGPYPFRAPLGNAAYLLSFAPLTGFEPMLVKQKREGHMAPRVRVEGWVIRGSNPGPWD